MPNSKKAVVLLTEDELSGSLNVAVILLVVETPVALAAGTVALTVGAMRS